MKNFAASNATRRLFSLVFLAGLLGAAGCKGFFPPLTTTTGTTPVNTGDYVYVASSYTGATTPIYTVSGFSIGTGTLTALSGFPVTLPFAPATMAVNPANSLLYVAGAGVLYGYSIAASGALTSILSSTNSAALVNANIVSMDISPDGQWLVAIDASTSVPTVDEFQIGSTGQLTVESSTTYSPFLGGASIAPSSIRIAPTGTYVAAALGTGGDVLFSFNTTTGALAPLIQVNTLSTASADQALAFDSTASMLYVVRSGTAGGVYPFAIGSDGSLTEVTGAPFATGAGPYAVTIDATDAYLYVADRVDSRISGFSIGTGGVLTAISGSPFVSGTTVNALAVDNSGKYLLATASGGTPDLQMYSYDATVPGKLDAAAQASTGDPTEPAGALALALTH